MNIQTKKSSNDYSVLHVQKDSPVSFIMFLVKNGSRNETAHEQGISHFVEHMMFKATKNRTSSKIINTEIESIGGIANAFTGQEHTGYYIQVLKENFDHAFEILADILQNGLLFEHDIEIEKGVIIEEINMYEDSPAEKVHMLSCQNVFPDQPLGRDILGTKKTVSNFNAEQIKEFLQTNYLQNNFLVVSAGNFDIDRTLHNTENHLKKRKNGTLDMQRAMFRPKEKINFYSKDDINQAHAVLSYKGVSSFDEYYYNYLLLETVLGSGMGSILFDLLREQLGVAYYVGADTSTFSDTGVFSIFFGANFDKTEETVDRIFGQLKKLKTEQIDESELNRAKNLLYSSLAMRYESIGFLGKKFGEEYLIRGKIETLEEERKQIFAISAEDILETAGKVFNNSYNITYIANKKLL